MTFTINGLRLLHKSAPWTIAMRLNLKRKELRRIVYYSRFANQNLRNHDRSLTNKLIGDCSEGGLDNTHNRHSLANNQCRYKSSTVSIQGFKGEKGDDYSEQRLIQGSDIKSSPVDQQEFNENDYIFNHIHKRLDKYANIGGLLHTLPISSKIDRLRNLVCNSHDNQLNEDAIEKLLKETIDSIRVMNQQELAILLTAIKNDKQKPFKRIQIMIDYEIRWLFKNHVKSRLMDLDLWFYIAGTFYECSVKSEFAHVLIHYLANNQNVPISNRQILHLLFLVILQRNHDGILSRYEERIFHILKQASFEDIAVICMAYFKTKTQIKNVEMLRHIIDKTAEMLPSIDPKQPGYCSIIKAIRYSRNTSCRNNILHLVMTLVQDLDSRIILTSSYNAVHTIKLMESFRVYDNELLEIIVKILFSNLDEFRIKDIQYVLSSLSNFAYKDLLLDENIRKKMDDLSDTIVSETRSDVEYQYHHILPILRAFSILNYYNDGLFDYCNKLLEDPEKLEGMRDVLEFDRTMLLVYVATRLEGGNVKLGKDVSLFKKISGHIERSGNMGSVRQDGSIKHLDFILRNTAGMSYYSISNRFREIASMLASCKELEDPSYTFTFQYTLPHANFADLIVSRFHQAPGQFREIDLMPRKLPADERHCLIMATKKEDYVDGHRRLSGYKRFVSRLLTKIGYTVIQVDINEPDIVDTAQKIKLALGSNTS